jgi:hypothetical protein
LLLWVAVQIGSIAPHDARLWKGFESTWNKRRRHGELGVVSVSHPGRMMDEDRVKVVADVGKDGGGTEQLPPSN